MTASRMASEVHGQSDGVAGHAITAPPLISDWLAHGTAWRLPGGWMPKRACGFRAELTGTADVAAAPTRRLMYQPRLQR
jgi:hypothetical protein